MSNVGMKEKVSAVDSDLFVRQVRLDYPRAAFRQLCISYTKLKRPSSENLKKMSFFRILFYSSFIERKKRAKKKGKTENDFKRESGDF
jgi:CRISPR/Cas system CSM-associated protein Csm4 (group 5 of RAMP superfamily)